MVDRVLELPAGSRLVLYAPYVRGKKGEYRKQLSQMVREGFIRARIDGEMVDLQGELPTLDKRKKHSIDIVVDRVASTSWVSALPDPERAAVLSEVRALLERHPATRRRERFPFPHATVVLTTTSGAG